MKQKALLDEYVRENGKTGKTIAKRITSNS
jgi:hypothetical protein